MKPQLKYGLLVGLASFVIFVVINEVDADRGNILYYMGMFVLTFGIYFTLRDTRDTVGNITYGRGLGLGVLCALVAGTTEAIGRYVFCKFIDNRFVLSVRHLYLDALQKSPSAQYTPDQMDLVKRAVPFVISPGSMALGEIVATVFIGFLISLIVAGILRKDPNTGMPGF